MAIRLQRPQPEPSYRRVDERIGATYRKRSRAQNTNSLSDMYVRFWRWASDRLRGDGVIAMVTNRNFIEKVAFDGFRLSVAEEFAECWVMDLGGDVRANPKLSGTKHNVFGIQTGVCIAFMVRKSAAKGFALRYARRPEEEIAEEKLAFLDGVEDFGFWRVEQLRPDPKGSWLTAEHDDWGGYLPLADPSKGPEDEISEDMKLAALGGVPAIFRLSSNGVTTQRDEWVWSDSRDVVNAKAKALIVDYERQRLVLQKLLVDAKRYEIKDKSRAAENAREAARRWQPEGTIKWDDQLESSVRSNLKISHSKERAHLAQFRPFERQWLYFDKHLNGRRYRLPSMYAAEPNATIAIRGVASQDQFTTQATDRIFDAAYLKTGNGRTFGVTRYRYTPAGERVDNITDWALAQFRARYASPSPSGEGRSREAAEGWGVSAGATLVQTPHPNPSPEGEGLAITKDAIFAYCYAALHDPVYRETHADDLRREFPRVPLHDDFAQWVAWGETLLSLHIDYEQVQPFPLTRTDAPDSAKARTARAPTPKLKSYAEQGLVIVDSATQFTGIPPAAWRYRLGNRSAIDWVLDQHKEKTPRDPTVRAKFNTYRFADHKEAMIVLLAKVVRVSLDTVAITDAMAALPRD